MLGVSKLLQPLWKEVRTVRRFSHHFNDFLMMLRNLPQPQLSCLSNGVRVVTEYRDVDFVCVGLFFDAGSKYEDEFDNGVAHFFQHIVFKGTRNRTKECVNAQMACTGARFKAFAERELVGFYAQCLVEDMPLCIDILSDSIFQNCFNPVEIEKAKCAVYHEMKEHDDDTNKVLMDYLHGAAFQGTPLAKSVLGPSGNLNGFSDAVISRYIKQNFDPTRTVLVAVGGIPHQCVHDLGQLYLNHLEPAKCSDHVYRFTSADVRYRNDDLPYANVAIAFEAPNFCHHNAYVMDMAAAFLGGWDSRMPRDHYPAPVCSRAAAAGLADACQGFYIKHKDAGLWGMQYTAPRLDADDLCYNFQQECMRLCLAPTEEDCERARNELMTALVTELNYVPNECKDIARWYLFNGSRPSLLDRINEYRRIGKDRMKDLCEELVYDRNPAVAAVGNIEVVPEYNRIISGNYWARI